MRLTYRVAFARRCLVAIALSMVIPRTALWSQATSVDSSQTTSGKQKSEAPFLAFSIGIQSALVDSSKRDSWSVTQFTFIPKRWPNWEVGLVGHAGNGPTSNPYVHFDATGMSFLLGHRWSPVSYLRLGVRGTAGSLTTQYSSHLFNGTRWTATTEKSRIGFGSIETVAEFKVWRWVHAEINGGYRQTGQPSAPVWLTTSTLSGFTWGYTLRLGNFP